MEELDLYKFCQDKELDWRGDKLILWLDHYDLPRFAELLGDHYLCEGGVPIRLITYGNIALELNDICDDFDIEPERIKERSEP